MRKNSGQSLIEVLIAAGVGVILITSAVLIISPALKGSTTSTRLQVSTALGQELMENVRVWGEANWNTFAALATTSVSQYYLNTSSSPFVAVSGSELLAMATSTYVRYFYIDDVFRDVAGAIVTTGGFLDLSTKKVTVAYGFQGANENTLVTYVTRSNHKVFMQSNWSDGSGVSGVVTSSIGGFTTSTVRIDVASTTGSILLSL